VHCQLYLRRAIGKLGVAHSRPCFSTARRRRATLDDYRPQVHDSDGFMTETVTGNGSGVRWAIARAAVNRFMDENPRGFGLIQRERDFNRYQDVEAQYQARSSYWVEPLGTGARAE